MGDEVETTRTPPGTGRGRRLVFWAVVAFAAVPPTIVLHELGHYAAARAFRFPGVVLHYGSVDDDAETAGRPAWQRGVKSAAGPIVTVLLVLASCVAARRFGPRPLAVAPGFAAGVRSVIIGAAFLLRLALGGRSSGGGFDEAHAAARFGVPVGLVVGVFAAAVLAGWADLARILPAPGRWATLGSIAAGIAAGIGLWVVIGPILLP